MPHATAAVDEDLARTRRPAASFTTDTATPSGPVSWPAILAGAAAAASLSLILLILGVGLGLSSVSPWSREGVSASTFGVSTILWITITQLLASAMGGYLAGRLRTKWTDAHTDEVYFRDTAHGFLAWAVASLATAALLSSVIGTVLGGGVQAGASIVGRAPNSANTAVGNIAAATGTAQGSDGGSTGYLVDSLFRREPAAIAAPTAAGAQSEASAAGQDAHDRATGKDAAEVSRIILNVSRTEPLPPEDIRYIGQIVVARTGLTQQVAEKRVTDIYGRAQAKAREADAAARDTADKARKASAYGALWLFVSLLIGAFVASLAATFGGRQRDA